MTKKDTPPAKSFRALINRLEDFWARQSCVVLEPYDMPMGAATFHPATFLGALGDKPWRCVYMQGCRRPGDGRYGDNPNRLQFYYQMQALLKPPPNNIQDLYLESLEAVGIHMRDHDIRFVEDNWESPTLGAWGLGWEVRVDGMEVSQFTYFQQVGGVPCAVPSGEITYGLERMAMFLQGVDHIYDLVWDDRADNPVKYGDIYRQNELEQSKYNFEHDNTDALLRQFDDAEKEASALLDKDLLRPAYEQIIQASHLFNLLDARKAFSVIERQRYMLRTRTLAEKLARHYVGAPQDETPKETPQGQRRSKSGSRQKRKRERSKQWQR